MNKITVNTSVKLNNEVNESPALTVFNGMTTSD